MTETIALRRLGSALGAELTGLDLSHQADAATIAAVERALDDHAVVLIRGQRLDAASLAAFAHRFGAPQFHVVERFRHPSAPEISFISNVDAQGRPDPFGNERATSWHTDATYEPRLPRLAMLHALEVPSAGGGTLFADMRAAHDALDAAMQARLAALTGLHRFNSGPVGRLDLYRTEVQGKKFADQRHPAVLKHPRTGRPILFTNPSHAHGFVGMGKDEGWALVETLGRHATQERFVYHHHWQVGDLLIWDELATIHRGAGGFDPNQRRIMLRSIVYPP
jgi:taurine dioxygenase